MLLHKDREQFIAIVNAVSNEMSIPIPIMEKDYSWRIHGTGWRAMYDTCVVTRK